MLRILCFCLWLPCAALAQSFPEPLSDTVNDFADLLTTEQAADISASLRAARDETGVHIVLTIIAQQADYGSDARFADFATQWFNAWGIGDATRNDGVLILVSAGDREMRIVLGDAYGPVWDGRAQRVIDTAMLPAFRDEDYPRGLADGAASAVDRLARPFAADEDVTETSGFPAEETNWETPMVIVVMVLVMAWHGFRDRISGAFLRLKRCPNCGSRGLEREDETVMSATETLDGRVNRHLRCPQCGNDRVTHVVLPALKGTQSGGSSGFGGGSSSGGGASGKW